MQSGTMRRMQEFFKSQDFFLAAIFILASVISFCLGRLSVEEAQDKIVPILPEASEESAPSLDIVHAATQTVPLSASARSADTSITSSYVASKNGTKYHLPWCAGASQIKEENKIWFKTKAEAEAAGYSPAANCKGI